MTTHWLAKLPDLDDPEPILPEQPFEVAAASTTTTSSATAPPMSALEAAWSAVRACQRAADIPGLILAQAALELVDSAARRG